MKQYKVKKPFKKKLGRFFLAIGCLLFGLVILVDLRIRPIMYKTSAYQCQIYGARIINQALLDELQRDTFDYTDLITTVRDAGGKIQSMESNMYAINQLKAQCTQRINEEIKAIEPHDLGVSLGTVSGVHMLYGKGPMIPIRLTPRGYAETALVSKFTSAGINQTLHQIELEVFVDMSAIIPGYTTSVQIRTNFVVAETVIVGEVPNAYTHIISGNPDLVNKIGAFASEGG